MLFKCAHRAPAADQAGGPIVRNGSKSLVVDIHCHRECAQAADMMKAAQAQAPVNSMSAGNPLTQEVNAKQQADIRPQMESVERRLADMDAMGVDIQAVSIAPYQYFYWADPELGREVTRVINDDLAELVAAHSDRFVGLATVPLQNTEMAVAELERAVKELGHRGVEINSHVGGEDLSSPRFEAFFAKAEELGALIFIHTAGHTRADRLGDHYFFNLIGHPLEATLAISHLIFGGVLERYPGLKICVAHGGGYLPPYAGRMDHAYHAREDVRDGLPKPPSAYLKKFYFDTMVFEPDQLGYLIDKFGADHILVGTDYPYDMGHYDPLGLVGRIDGLSDDDRAAIHGGTAAKLLNLA